MSKSVLTTMIGAMAALGVGLGGSAPRLTDEPGDDDAPPAPRKGGWDAPSTTPRAPRYARGYQMGEGYNLSCECARRLRQRSTREKGTEGGRDG